MPQIEVFRPSSNESFQIINDTWTPEELFTRIIGSPYEQGWWFSAGNPEYWKFSDRLLVPGGNGLDLGMGLGRSSLFFALQGMEVTGYDIDPHALLAMRAITSAYNLPIDILDEDITKADFGKDRFDTTILSDTLVHFPSIDTAIAVIDKAIDATKPGGHVFLRAVGKEDEAYWNLSKDAVENPAQVSRVDRDVFIAPCSCSGEVKMEPHLFFDQIALLPYMAQKGMDIIHSQIMPTALTANILYGEDWSNQKGFYFPYGFITIIGQKK